MGRSPTEIRALLITHGDGDRVDFAWRLRQEYGVPVFVGSADSAEARGEAPKPATVRDPIRVAPRQPSGGASSISYPTDAEPGRPHRL